MIFQEPAVGVDCVLHQTHRTLDALPRGMQGTGGLLHRLLSDKVARIEEQDAQSQHEDGGSQQRDADAEFGGEVSANPIHWLPPFLSR